MISSFVLLRRAIANKHGKAAPFHLGGLFNNAVFRNSFFETLQKIVAQMSVGHLTSAESDRHLDLVPRFQETDGLADFGVQIVRIDIQRHSDFLDIDRLLILSRLFVPLGLFKTILAIVHDTADRRLRLRRNLDEIEILFSGDPHRFFQLEYAKLSPVRIDDTDLFVADFLIDEQFFFADGKAPPLPGKQIDMIILKTRAK